MLPYFLFKGLLSAVVLLSAIHFLVVSLVLRRPRRDDPSLRGGEGEGSQLGICTPEEHQRELAEFDRQLYGTPFPYFTAEQIAEQAELARQQQLAMATMLQNLGLQNSQYAQMQNIANMPLNSFYSPNQQQCPPSLSQQSDLLNWLDHVVPPTPASPLLARLLGLSKNNKGNLS